MKKILTLAAAAMLLSSTAFAGGTASTFEFGFNSTDAPVGGRYWFNETTAIDAGFGFSSMDETFDNGTDPATTETVTDFTVAGGVTFIVKDYGSAYFFVRPGVSFSSMGQANPDADSATMFSGMLSLGGEVHMHENVSLNFQHGLHFSSMSPGGDADSITSFGTFGANLTSAGVYIRFN